MKVFTPAQMRAFDEKAVLEYSIPSIVLMENAALRVVEFLEWKFAPLKDKRVVVLCGKGSNGGDGFAIARHLSNAGCFVWAFISAAPEEMKGDTQANYAAAQKYRFVMQEFGKKLRPDELPLPFDRASNYLIVDALFGTGFQGEIEDKKSLNLLASLSFTADKVVAVDIPSGLDADSGRAATRAFKADYTVTFVAPKRGMFLRDGIANCGEIWIGDVGAKAAQWDCEDALEQNEPACAVITAEYAHPLLPQRPVDAHKGTAGKVIIIGGSRGMSGAPALASTAALRVGAGLCIAALPDRVLDVFAASVLEATLHALPCDDEGRLVSEAADALPTIWKNADIVALGPGLSRSDGALNFARRVVRECELPLVIDADALYSLRAISADVEARVFPTILTPHPGEMAELMESDAKSVNENRLEIAVECARKFNAIVVLKGARSIVASPEGETWFNLTGNAGMATGGSGDVLTGTIVGLMAQLKDALRATLLGVYLHGLAGDIEYSKSGNGLIAHDIADALPQAILNLQQRPTAQQINARLRKLE